MTDTIAAIATASEGGSISIIRISGPDAVVCVDKIFFRKQGASLVDEKTHTIHYGYIKNNNDDIVDEVLVLIMLAPKSYTAEDVIEIHCHGGGIAAKSVLNLLLNNGVRLAEPGEFTKRAFLNGRIDLSQAEAVMDVISSKSELELSTAEKHLKGDVKDLIRNMREVILTDMAYLEAALDDPEHIELDDYSEKLLSHLAPIEDKIKHLLDHCENGRLISSGLKTAIVGRPNVGKSSFLNRILREDRAIVTDVPGTTRDTLEEDVIIGGVRLRLIDTAGIRQSDDPVEKIGIDRARDAFADADFIIHIIDSSESLSIEDKELIEIGKEKPGVIILNKSDLTQEITKDDIITDRDIIDFSAETGEGLIELETLLESVVKELIDDGNTENSDPIITSARQKEALIKTMDSISRIRETVDAGMPEDLLTVDLMGAYTFLGLITGDTIEDDLADKIFSEFCMGK